MFETSNTTVACYITVVFGVKQQYCYYLSNSKTKCRITYHNIF
ncbi:hypothetical protein TASCI_80068 [Tenacibaculum ascidiaceicola]